MEVDVDLSGAQTIGDVLGTINASGANVQATLNATGTALQVRSANPTTVAVVTEVGSGQSATVLGLQGGRDMFKTLGLLQEALQKNDTPALNALLTSLDEARSSVSALHTELGVRTSTVATTEERQADLTLQVTEMLSNTEESDVAEVFTRLTQLNTGLQAALASTARILQTTLLDFLR
jgi:flagellar hook-associated protein 3 FlgL